MGATKAWEGRQKIVASKKKRERGATKDRRGRQRAASRWATEPNVVHRYATVVKSSATLLNQTPLHNVQKFNLPQCPTHTHQPTEPTEPTTAEPTTAELTTAELTTEEPTTAEPTTAEPTTEKTTTVKPTTVESTTVTKSSRNKSYKHWNILYHADFYNQVS